MKIRGKDVFLCLVPSEDTYRGLGLIKGTFGAFQGLIGNIWVQMM